MGPANLTARSFDAYPPQARSLAVRHLDLLRRLPPVLAPLLLGRVIGFDDQFPAEQQSLQRELDYINALDPGDLDRLAAGFAAIRLAGNLETINWVDHPAVFSQQLSTFLWSTNQMDRFRDAAETWSAHLRTAVPEPAPPIPRLCVVIVGQGATADAASLFHKLRPHGVCFTSIHSQDGLAQILALLDQRATAHPFPYAHWYIDGGTASPAHSAAVSCVSWAALASARKLLTGKMKELVNSGTGGPESLAAMMAQLQPKDLGLASVPAAPSLDMLQLKVLTEGSGTQIFSTTFVQWSTREVLRRAQPLTLVARFAPRQRYRPMNELLAGDSDGSNPDPEGSLIDADMGAYYTWLDLRRLAGADQSIFVTWFEDHELALVVSPVMPAGTESANIVDLGQLLKLVL
jgi:hypothetical protein